MPFHCRRSRVCPPLLTAVFIGGLLCGCGLQVSPVIDDRQHGAVADRRLIVQSDVEWSVLVGEGRPIYGRGNRTIDLPDRGSVCVMVSLLAGTGRLRAWIVPDGEPAETEEPQRSLRLCSSDPVVLESEASLSGRHCPALGRQ